MSYKLSCISWKTFIFTCSACIIKELDGDEAYVTWVIEGKLGQANIGSFAYTGGTGKHEGLSGDAGIAIGHIVTNYADGDAGGYALWNRMK